jgi:hypothetical protein
MKTYNSLIIIIGFLFTISSCSIFHNHILQRQESKYSKFFHDSPTSFSLLVEGESLLKLNNNIILRDKNKKTLLGLDTSKITQFNILSNFKTTQEYKLAARSELVVIITKDRIPDKDISMNGYEFLISQLEEWFKSNSYPIVVIDGLPFKYEIEYRPFLEELKDSDIFSIDILKENSAMRIYNYKSVLIVTTKYRI